MENAASILDKLSEGRVPILAKMAASPTADCILVADFSSSETLYQNLEFIGRTVESAEGILGLAVEGVVVAAFSGPSAAVRTAVEFQRSRFGRSGIRIAVHSAAGAGINQRGLSQAIALLKSATHGQILVNESVRNIAILDTEVRCTRIRS